MMMKCVATMTEETLQQACVAAMSRKGWSLVAQEWAVNARREGLGRGDLVFKKPGRFLVIEVKRRAIPKVYEQAKYYGAIWKVKMRPSDRRPVSYGVFTCSTKRTLGVIRTREHALRTCTRKGICSKVAFLKL
jgi:Holliday junction resolvase-like predicted endonuclease